MDIQLVPPDAELPVDRAYALSMTIRSFKGRRDVEVHLFRHAWDPEEEAGLDWDALLATPGMDEDECAAGSRHVILESFTAGERDAIVGYLQEQYASRLSSVFSGPIPFPVPVGLVALSDLSAGKSIGFIYFERIPHYTLGIPLRGLYDLSQHRPIVDAEASEG